MVRRNGNHSENWANRPWHSSFCSVARKNLHQFCIDFCAKYINICFSLSFNSRSCGWPGSVDDLSGRAHLRPGVRFERDPGLPGDEDEAGGGGGRQGRVVLHGVRGADAESERRRRRQEEKALGKSPDEYLLCVSLSIKFKLNKATDVKSSHHSGIWL